MKDIFASKCEAIVNPVNCVGVMGAGLALAFKNKFPQNFLKYKIQCDQKKLTVGKCLTTYENNKYIINFPTKDHYKDPSKIEYIKEGLLALSRHIEHYDIKSIAIPALGAGLGDLKWSEVKPLLEEFVKKHPNVTFEIFEPQERQTKRQASFER